MVKVIKRDNSIEDFDPEKIKRAVLSAGQDAGLSQDEISALIEGPVSKIIDDLEEIEGEIKSTEIRERILTTLKETAPSLVTAWERYDREQKGIT